MALLLILIPVFIIPPFIAFVSYTNWNLIRARKWSLLNAGFMVVIAVVAPLLGVSIAYACVPVFPGGRALVVPPAIAILVGSISAASMLGLAVQSARLAVALITVGVFSAIVYAALALTPVINVNGLGPIFALFAAMVAWHAGAIIGLNAWSSRIEDATRHLCGVCDYDLSQVASNRCPECGERIAGEETPSTSRSDAA